jgi:hypothetical protein
MDAWMDGGREGGREGGVGGGKRERERWESDRERGGRSEGQAMKGPTELTSDGRSTVECHKRPTLLMQSQGRENELEGLFRFLKTPNSALLLGYVGPLIVCQPLHHPHPSSCLFPPPCVCLVEQLAD